METSPERDDIQNLVMSIVEGHFNAKRRTHFRGDDTKEFLDEAENRLGKALDRIRSEIEGKGLPVQFRKVGPGGDRSRAKEIVIQALESPDFRVDKDKNEDLVSAYTELITLISSAHEAIRNHCNIHKDKGAESKGAAKRMIDEGGSFKFRKTDGVELKNAVSVALNLASARAKDVLHDCLERQEVPEGDSNGGAGIDGVARTYDGPYVG